MADTLPVIFRTYPEGDVIAVFPTIIETYDGQCLNYQHLGQHAHSHYSGVVQTTRLATPDEYTPLLHELQAIGYDNLVIRKRVARHV